MDTLAPAHRTRTPLSPVLAAGIAFALSTACTALAIFGPQRQQDQVDAFPALVLAAAVVTGLLFWFVVRPAAAGGATARRVLVLALLAVASLAVFWTGLPAILGMAALAVRPHVAPSHTRAVGTWLAVGAIVAHAVSSVVA